MPINPVEFHLAGLREIALGVDGMTDYRNFYQTYSCAMSATEWFPNPLYFTTRRFSNGHPESYQVIDFHAPVFWSLSYHLRDAVTGTHAENAGPTPDKGPLGLKLVTRPYGLVAPGPTVVPALSFSEEPLPAAPFADERPDDAPEQAGEAGAARYPPIPDDAIPYLLTGHYTLVQEATVDRSLALYRRIWAYDDYHYVTGEGRTLRVIYRLEPVTVDRYAAPTSWLIAFDVNGGRLERINANTVAHSIEFAGPIDLGLGRQAD